MAPTRTCAHLRPSNEETHQRILHMDSVKAISQEAILTLRSDISEDEVLTTIKQQKPNSAPGPDTLTAKIYQSDPTTFTSILTPIFNLLLYSSSDMTDFTESITTMIPKK
eukprot:TRINITY_DN235_c0_g1_i19.p1 TRINITY_DN235_c0_g1~~TRINITY_DN235_c0_g1_i19.p1  ORF type:complete len:110 (+),score=14.10 TRINITY_DN235_c0_g1_i19:402-731(+)